MARLNFEICGYFKSGGIVILPRSDEHSRDLAAEALRNDPRVDRVKIHDRRTLPAIGNFG